MLLLSTILCLLLRCMLTQRNGFNFKYSCRNFSISKVFFVIKHLDMLLLVSAWVHVCVCVYSCGCVYMYLCLYADSFKSMCLFMHAYVSTHIRIICMQLEFLDSYNYYKSVPRMCWKRFHVSLWWESSL